MGVRLPSTDLVPSAPPAASDGRVAVTATADRAELVRALAALAEEPRMEHRRLADLLGLPPAPEPGAYAELFLMNLYPYASVHLGAEGMLGGEARDRVAGFWRALAMTPPGEPDHLGALLGLLAAVMEREAGEGDPARQALLHQARMALVWEHLLPWMPPFLERVRDTGGDYYGPWASLLLELLEEEASWLVLDRRDLPVHLAEAPGLPDPRDRSPSPEAGPSPESGDDFLLALLAPVRSGMILTRRDLDRAGETLGLGVRKGERLYILRALLAQAPSATLGWLAGEADAWVRRHRGATWWDERIKTFWEARAGAAARLLEELAATSEGETDHA